MDRDTFEVVGCISIAAVILGQMVAHLYNVGSEDCPEMHTRRHVIALLSGAAWPLALISALLYVTWLLFRLVFRWAAWEIQNLKPAEVDSSYEPDPMDLADLEWELSGEPKAPVNGPGVSGHGGHLKIVGGAGPRE